VRTLKAIMMRDFTSIEIEDTSDEKRKGHPGKKKQ